MSILNAQGIRGAEFFKHVIGDKEVIAQLKVYSLGLSKDSILINWGDNTLEYINLQATTEHSSGYKIDIYTGIHTYDSVGYYELVYTDSFLVSNVKNITNSNQKTINLRDSFYVFNSNHPFESYLTPNFVPTQFLINNDGGVISHWIEYEPSPNILSSTFISKLAPFPTEGYSTPPASDSIYIENELFVWDKPLELGTYAIAFQIRQFQNDLFDEFPGDSFLLSTTHRAMMIDIDSSIITASNEPVIFKLNEKVNVFPNPATKLIVVQTDGIINYILNLYDSLGKLVLSNIFGSEIDVSHLPPGIYLLEIVDFDSGQKTIKKVIVT